MAVVIAFSVALFIVLVAAAVTGLRWYDEMKRQAKHKSLNPILDIKRRFDLGEITREEFEREIREELDHPHHRKAG